MQLNVPNGWHSTLSTLVSSQLAMFLVVQLLIAFAQVSRRHSQLTYCMQPAQALLNAVPHRIDRIRSAQSGTYLK